MLLTAHWILGRLLTVHIREDLILLNLTLFCVLRDVSFSMMIWLFGVSLFHLSIAARNELRVKSVLHYIFLELFVNLILMASVLITYTSLFGTIAQSVMDQISILISIYIAKRKLFPAMNSRIMDAFVYLNFNLINLLLIYFITRKNFKRMHC